MFSDREALAVGLAMSKLEAITGANAVALIMVSPDGELQVMFPPGNEIDALKACREVDWDSCERIVQEYSGC
jgi:hypothetical protein